MWSAAPVATVILALAMVAIVFFGARSALFWAGHPPRAGLEQPVEAWMTPRYIARARHIPPEVILDAIAAPRPPPDGPMSLAALADYRGVAVETVIAEVEAALAAFGQGAPQPAPRGDDDAGSADD